MVRIQTEVEDTRSVTRVALHTFFLVVLIVLSLGGNSLVCLAMYRNRRLRSVSTNLYILALAVADMMLAILVFPFSAIASALREWPFSHNFCQFNGFTTYYWGAVSVFTLALTAINRYFCIVKPQRYLTLFTKKKIVASLVLTWVFSLLLGITITVLSKVVFQWHPTSLFCKEIRSNNSPRRLFAVLSIGLCIVLSTLCIMFCYGNVFKAIRKHNIAVAPSLQGGSRNEQLRRADEVKTCRILFAAVVGVCASWLPTVIILVLEYCFNLSVPTDYGYLRVLIALISTFINPIIYGVMNRAMRKEFFKILSCML